MTTLCTIPSCRMRGRHLPACTDDQCQGCLPRVADDGLVCDADMARLRGWLAEIADLAPIARDIARGLSRTQSAYGGSGVPESRVPLDLTATAKCDGAGNALGTWVRHVAEERGLRTPQAGTYSVYASSSDPLEFAALWLAEHVDWIRHRPEVDEFFADVRAAVRVLRSVTAGPSEQKYLGPCGAWVDTLVTDEAGTEMECRQCEGDVYGRLGAELGRCKTCGATVSQAEREIWLDDVRRDWLYHASEIADAYPIKGNTIRAWLSRGLLVAHGEHDGRPLLKLGEVLDLAAGDAARREEARAARARRREGAAA